MKKPTAFNEEIQGEDNFGVALLKWIIALTIIVAILELIRHLYL